MAPYRQFRSSTNRRGGRDSEIREKPSISEKNTVTELKYSAFMLLFFFNFLATDFGII